MYSIKGKQAARIKPITFSELNMTENDIEEILRNSIDMICDEEESINTGCRVLTLRHSDIRRF